MLRLQLCFFERVSHAMETSVVVLGAAVVPRTDFELIAVDVSFGDPVEDVLVFSEALCAAEFGSCSVDDKGRSVVVGHLARRPEQRAVQRPDCAARRCGARSHLGGMRAQTGA